MPEAIPTQKPNPNEIIPQAVQTGGELVKPTISPPVLQAGVEAVPTPEAKIQAITAELEHHGRHANVGAAEQPKADSGVVKLPLLGGVTLAPVQDYTGQIDMSEERSMWEVIVNHLPFLGHRTQRMNTTTAAALRDEKIEEREEVEQKGQLTEPIPVAALTPVQPVPEVAEPIAAQESQIQPEVTQGEVDALPKAA